MKLPLYQIDAFASGPFVRRGAGEDLAMDFPARPPERVAPPAGIEAALGAAPREVWRSRDLMAVFDAEEDVRAVRPGFDAISALGGFGVIVTAPGREADFVSRFFAPLQGVPEDPATGSSHCTLVPYWAERLGRPRLTARQLSKRGGELRCEAHGDRVTIAGRAVKYLEGVIEV